MSKKSMKIQNNLTCDIRHSGNRCDNQHILRNPRKLPCGKTVCLECVEVLSDSKNTFRCIFCKRTHCLIKDLSRNMMAEYAIDENLFDLCTHFVDKLRKSCLNIKEISLEKKLTLINVIDFIKTDIEVRVESVDVELQKLKISLDRTIEQMANERFERCRNKFQKFCQSLKNKPGFPPIDLIHFYEELSKQLNQINDLIIFNTFTLLKTSKIKPESLFKTSDIIGQLKWSDKNIYNIENEFRPRSIRLNFHPYDISVYLNNKFIATDRQGDCLYILNRKLSQILRKVEQIGDRKELVQPTRILVDDKKQMIHLICSKNKNEIDEKEILIADSSLTNVLFLITSENSPTFADLNLNINGNLIVFDSLTSSVFKFCFDKKVLNLISKLEIENESGDLPNRSYDSSFTNELLAVNVSNKSVIIYNFRSNVLESKILIDTGDYVKVFGIYFEKPTSRLFVHLNDADDYSQIRCYEKNSSGCWVCVFERALQNVGTGSWRMNFINEHLFLTLWSQNLVIC
jgi:hypothetical protein